jgi:outer membrane protein TolC
VNFAEKSFTYRETGRSLALIEKKLIPQADQSLAAVQASYRAGMMGFSSLTDAERILLDLKLAAAEARTAHEIALADLSLMVAGVPPPDAPFLSNAP